MSEFERCRKSLKEVGELMGGRIGRVNEGCLTGVLRVGIAQSFSTGEGQVFLMRVEIVLEVPRACRQAEHFPAHLSGQHEIKIKAVAVAGVAGDTPDRLVMRSALRRNADRIVLGLRLGEIEGEGNDR